MKLFTTVAVGALLLAGCAPFEHGHFAADVAYENNVGDRPGTPVLIGGYEDPYYGQAIAAQGGYSHPHSKPAAYSTPINYPQPATYSEPVLQPFPQQQVVHSAPQIVHSAPQVVHSAPQVIHAAPQQVIHSAPPLVQATYAEPVHHQPVHHQPIVQTYAEPVHHQPVVQTYAEPVHHQPVVQASYVEPVVHHSAPQYIEPPAPLATAYPIEKPHHYVDAAPIYERSAPVVTATSVSVEEERRQAPVVYAPPQVVNAPPVYMRGAPQYSNQPYPAPGYLPFGGQPPAPQYAPPPPPSYGPPQGYGVPQGYGGYSPQPYPVPPAFGGGYFGAPVAANTRPAYAPQGYGGYGASGCVTTCGNGMVF